MQLLPVVTPFGVAVDSAGRPRARLTLTIDGLPRPATLGAFTTYVAWAYTLTMDREHKLGEVRNGRTALGEIPVTWSTSVSFVVLALPFATRRPAVPNEFTQPAAK